MMYRREIYNKLKRAQALIIAIFVMMALSLIAWTVVNFSTADLNVGARLVESERALYVAQAGASWAIDQANTNASWCASSAQCRGSASCKIGFGEYIVSCANSGNTATIVSTGYVPSYNACSGSNRASCMGTRMVQVSSGGNTTTLGYLVQARYFDWSGLNSNVSALNGATGVDCLGPGSCLGSSNAQGYEGDLANSPNHAIHNQVTDYGVNLPPSNLTPAPSHSSIVGRSLINMDAWLPAPNGNATDTWPAPLEKNLRLGLSVFNLGNYLTNQTVVAQSFRYSGGGSGPVNVIRVLHGHNIGNPTGPVTLRIETDNGGAPSGNLFVDAPLPAGHYCDIQYTPVPLSWNTIVLPATVTFNNNTNYWMVFYTTNDQTAESRYTLRAGNYDGNGNAASRMMMYGQKNPVVQVVDETQARKGISPNYYVTTTNNNVVSVTGAWANAGHTGTNYYTSLSGDTINLTAAAPGTLHVSYSYIPKNWTPNSVSWNTWYDYTNLPTDPDIIFELSNINAVGTKNLGEATALDYLYMRANPLWLGDINNVEYDSAQGFIIRKWMQSTLLPLTISSVQIHHNGATGTPSNPITVTLQTDANGVPSGTVLGTATYSPGTGAGWGTATFPAAITVAYNTPYWIALDAPNSATSNYYNISGAGFKYGTVCCRQTTPPNPAGPWTYINEASTMMFKINLGSGNAISSSAFSGTFTGMDTEAVRNFSKKDDWGLSDTITKNIAAGTIQKTSLDNSDVSVSGAGIVNVTGVWTNSSCTGTNYYTGGYYNSTSGLITLGTLLPSASQNVWVSYGEQQAPLTLMQVVVNNTGIIGVTGVWANVACTGTNYYSGGSYNQNGVIALGSALPNLTNPVYVGYAYSYISPEWAVIDSHTSYGDIHNNDNNITDGEIVLSGINSNVAAGVWFENEDIEIVHRFVNTDNDVASQHNWYLAGGALFDSALGAISQFKKSFIAENDIGLAGNNTISLLVDNSNGAGGNHPAPILATQSGSIYATQPSSNVSSARTISGLVYTQNGNINFNYLSSLNSAGLGMAMIGNNVFLSGTVVADYVDNRVSNSTTGFPPQSSSGTGTGYSWGEQ